MSTRCLITGCALVLGGSEWFVWGDLHQQGDRFIFNSVVTSSGEPNWMPRWQGEDRFSGTRSPRILINPGTDYYFERRGVFVFAANRSMLNDIGQLRAGL